MIRDNEFDDYQIPEYDPTIPPDQRDQLIKEAQAELDAVIAKIYEATH